MQITQENDQGKLLFWVDVNLKKVDLSEYSGIEGDFGEEWEYKSTEVPKELIEEISSLNSKLNPEGKSPIEMANVETVVLEALNEVVKSNKANSFFLN
mgnify:CR=1 FL=1